MKKNHDKQNIEILKKNRTDTLFIKSLTLVLALPGPLQVFTKFHNYPFSLSATDIFFFLFRLGLCCLTW